MQEHSFGGSWTEEKLECLKGYLGAYTTIFTSNPKAKFFTTTYVDAFAGTGYRTKSGENDLVLFDDEDKVKYLKGSARIALEVQPPFNKYIFIDNNDDHITELQRLKNDFSVKNIEIHNANAQDFLTHWCRATNWINNRAVVFLDPYGMQVKWSLIIEIAKTQAIDLWWLFPLGISFNRLLTKNGLPPEHWAISLSDALGTEAWKDKFYKKKSTPMLWGEDETQCKTADFQTIGNFVIERLQTIFPGVAKKPFYLCNSKNIPLYLLCFAAGNPKGNRVAVKIAEYLLEKRN